jgi:hypothetical protein
MAMRKSRFTKGQIAHALRFVGLVRRRRLEFRTR